MVYDNTLGEPLLRTPDFGSGEPGYAIHDNGEVRMYEEPRYSLYEDDGKGNGNYICGSEDIYWIRRIAYALDSTRHFDYDANGNPK